MEVEKKLGEMGLELPPARPPLANFVPAVRTGNLLFLAAHVPIMPDGSMLNPGKLGRDVTIEQGYQSAQRAMLNCLSSIKVSLGDLDKVQRIVKLRCMVNCAPDFADQHTVPNAASDLARVANGASDLLVSIYGDRGRHARSAEGMGGLPFNSCFDVEMIVEVEE